MNGLRSIRRSFLTRIRRNGTESNSVEESSCTPSKALPIELSADNIGNFMKKYDTLLLDCDGVLWDTNHITKFLGIGATLGKFEELEKKVFFVTNNSMHAREQYVTKIKKLTGHTVNREDIYCVNYAAAVYLKEIAKTTGKVYVLGTPGLEDELKEVGIQSFGAGPDDHPTSANSKELQKIEMDPDVTAVAVGFDHNLNYIKLTKAAGYLLNKNCVFVATNDVERCLKIDSNHCQPLSGTMMEAVAAASQRRPDVVIGKPHKLLMDCIKAKHPDIDLSRTIMVGDSLRTDIKFAENCGVDSLLVFSGNAKRPVLDNFISVRNNTGKCPVALPTYFIASLEDIGPMI